MRYIVPVVLASLAWQAHGYAEAAGPVVEIEKATGIDRGVALIIGDTALAVQFAKRGHWLVHLAVRDAQRVSTIRDALVAESLMGRVHVTVLAADAQLPHPDRFINLIVADLTKLTKAAILKKEMHRVLAVRGAMWLRDNNKWSSQQAPEDPKIDGWYSRWYDASGNCVSHDRVVGFPVAVQWQHGPAMEDGTADGKIVRVADGRVIYLSARKGELICRDAGNGTLLWNRYVGLQQNADMIINSGRVYLWHDTEARPTGDAKRLSERGVLCAFDLKTGELAKQYTSGLTAGGAMAIEWQEADDRGKPRTRRRSPVPWFTVNNDVVIQAYANSLLVLDRKTGSKRWQHKCADHLTWFSPVASGDRVVAYEVARPARRSRHDGSSDAPAITAFSLSSGGRLWRAEGLHRKHKIKDKARSYIGRAGVKPLSLVGDRLLVQTASYQFRQGGSIALLDAKTGKEKWYRRFEPKERYTHGSYRAVLRGDEVVLMCGLGIARFSAADGKLIEEIEPPRERRQARRNAACTASRATDTLLIANAYLYLGDDGKPRTNFGARGQCGQGVVPANGLIYVLPTACDCGDYTRGYQALASKTPGITVHDTQRLIRGKAKASTISKEAVAWRHFLGSSTRQSCTGIALPKTLREIWRRGVGNERPDAVVLDRKQSERWLGALSAPTADRRVVVVSLPEHHEVVAIDIASGKVRWRKATLGKVDTPPTLSSGLAVYGSEGGFVTARSLDNGALVWQFQAAPTDGLVMHHGHFASTHPLPGTVLVLGDRVIALAGHHTDLGGLHAWVLDLRSGKILAKRILDAQRASIINNGVLVADHNQVGFWLGGNKSSVHLSLELKDLPAEKETSSPPLRFDRNGTRVRFRTADGRGGSTHGWKQAMQATAGGLRAHRVAIDGAAAYGLQDPTSRMRHKVNVASSNTLVAMRGTWREKKQIWATSQKALGNPESLSALIKAGDRLYLGGGLRDGSSGFVMVVDATSGSVLARHELPARVTECGIAAADGKLLVCCEDGTVICFGR
jgi:outer membrane protein assembly factor BamB